ILGKDRAQICSIMCTMCISILVYSACWITGLLSSTMIIQELQNCTKDKPRLLGTTKACRKEVPTSVGMSRVASLTSRLGRIYCIYCIYCRLRGSKVAAQPRINRKATGEESGIGRDATLEKLKFARESKLICRKSVFPRCGRSWLATLL